MNSPPNRSAPDAQIDVRRYLGALRRSRGLMAAIVIVITGGVLCLSLILPKTYEATAQIVFDASSDPLAPADSESIQRELATIDALINSTEVQAAAAEEIPGETSSSIEGKIASAVDPEANLVSITAADGDAKRAAMIANAVANSFLEVQRTEEQDRLAGAEAELQDEIARLEGRAGSEAQVAALLDRLNSIQVQRSIAGTDLSLAEAAEVPSSPSSPKPFRNTVLALFAAIFIAVLVALARDQLSPRIASPRELSRVLGAPVLASVPYVGRGRLGGRSRRISGAVEHEAYQGLRSALQLGRPPSGTQVILVTSASHAEGKTTVTAKLGSALARAGLRTLLVSADLRWPALHRSFDLPVEPGLTNVLTLIERGGVSEHLLPAVAHEISAAGGNSGQPPMLELIASGAKAQDPARLLSSHALHEFLQYVRKQSFDYVLIDAPPMLGIADVQGMVGEVDKVIIVSRLDRLTTERAMDMQELLERLAVQPMGLVVIGVRTDISPYYLTDRPAMFGSEPQSESDLPTGPRAYPG